MTKTPHSSPPHPHRSGHVKPSIQEALDETHPTGGYGQGGYGEVGSQPGHVHPSVATSHTKPENRTVFDPQDLPLPPQPGETPPGFGVIMPGAYKSDAEQQAMSDAVVYGEGFTRIEAGASGAVITNVPRSTVYADPSIMDFGEAIRAMERGERVERKGWNGKGMWIALSGLNGPRRVDADQFWSQPAREYAISEGGYAWVLPCVIMKTATGQILMGWLASQSDMLAKDWRIVK